MKVIDVLINSCVLLGLKNERAVLEGLTSDSVVNSSSGAENSSDSAVDSSGSEFNIGDYPNIAELLHLFRYSARELCSNYVPISNEIEVETEDCKYPIKNLENFIRVQGVLKDGEPQKYKIVARNIELKEDGKYTIKYLTYPSIDGLFDELDFLSNYSPDALVLGLCAYYSLSKGMFDEFSEFHDKYIERAESLKALRVFDLPKRRWV